MWLSELKNGARAIVREIYTSDQERARLGVMGLNKGDTINIIRRAPLNDPIQIKIKEYYLCIRVELANKIWVDIV